MSDTLAPSQPPGNSPFFSPLVFGNPGDVTARPEDITAVISLLKEASVCCCFVQENALIYYGARRLARVYFLFLHSQEKYISLLISPSGPRVVYSRLAAQTRRPDIDIAQRDI